MVVARIAVISSVDRRNFANTGMALAARIRVAKFLLCVKSINTRMASCCTSCELDSSNRIRGSSAPAAIMVSLTISASSFVARLLSAIVAFNWWMHGARKGGRGRLDNNMDGMRSETGTRIRPWHNYHSKIGSHVLYMYNNNTRP